MSFQLFLSALSLIFFSFSFIYVFYIFPTSASYLKWNPSHTGPSVEFSLSHTAVLTLSSSEYLSHSIAHPLQHKITQPRLTPIRFILSIPLLLFKAIAPFFSPDFSDLRCMA